MKTLVAVCAMLVCHSAAAQLFKCVDAGGKTTYSSSKCSELGLKDGGEIRDRLQVTPAPPPSARRAATPTPAPAPQVQPKPAAAEEPAKPERRCFTVKNAKGGTFTRCNDKPDESAQ